MILKKFYLIKNKFLKEQIADILMIQVNADIKIILPLTFILLMVYCNIGNSQPGTEDVGVYDTEILISPVVFPGGSGVGKLKFTADSGITLLPNEVLTMTICMSKLRFDFVDSLNPINEIFGDGAYVWDHWAYDTFSTCLVGSISIDKPALSGGWLHFPIEVTGSSTSIDATWSQNNINVNLQPHSNDAFNDTNDHSFASTYSFNPTATSDILDTFTYMNSSILFCPENDDLLGSVVGMFTCDSPDHGTLINFIPGNGCLEYQAELTHSVADHFCVIMEDEWGLTDTTLVSVDLILPPCGDNVLSISGAVQSQTYRAAVSIFSDAVVNQNVEAAFIASDEINLNPGFNVKINSTFLAETIPCD